MDTQNVNRQSSDPARVSRRRSDPRRLCHHAAGRAGPDAAKPNSVFNGVRIGCITYSYRGEITSAEDTLKALIEDGLSEVE